MFSFFYTVNEWVNFIAEEYSRPFLGAAAILILLIHIYSSHRTHEGFILPILALGVFIIFVALAVSPQSFSFGRMASLLLLYGVSNFVLISKAMTKGLALLLTQKRGPRWVKELDYVYLTIGSVGVLATVNRLRSSQGRSNPAI